MDLAALFDVARRAASRGNVCRALFGGAAGDAPGGTLLRNIVGVLPVRAVGEDGWEPIEPWLARERTLRPIIAVRVGQQAGGTDAMLDMVEHYPGGLPTARGRVFLESWSALYGSEIIDLLACDWAMAKPPRRLLGMAATLGFGADGHEDTWEGDAPVQLCRGVGEWVRTLFRGRACVLLGSAQEQQDTVRRFGGGVVCQDLAHGEAVERLLRRPLPTPPSILVKAA